MSPTIRSCAVTHPGAVRTSNQDAFVERPDLGLWAVADGAGGHQAGEVASRMIADALEAIPPHLSGPEMLAQVRLRMAATHAALHEEAARRGEGALVASTIVLLLVRDGHYACLWAGDSRAYLLRQGALSAITRDHSLVQELVDSGALEASAAEGHPQANVITRAVGAALDMLELDKVIGDVRPGDCFLLCSDGLCKTLQDAEIAAWLSEADAAPAARLVEAALAREAGDNVTAVAVMVGPRDG